jgi:hypothetical protein
VLSVASFPGTPEWSFADDAHRHSGVGQWY